MSKKVTPRICANCKWCEEADFFEGEYMNRECHRFPPIVIASSGRAVWPKVSPRSSCGEFAPPPRLACAAALVA